MESEEIAVAAALFDPHCHPLSAPPPSMLRGRTVTTFTQRGSLSKKSEGNQDVGRLATRRQPDVLSFVPPALGGADTEVREWV